VPYVGRTDLCDQKWLTTNPCASKKRGPHNSWVPFCSSYVSCWFHFLQCLALYICTNFAFVCYSVWASSDWLRDFRATIHQLSIHTVCYSVIWPIPWGHSGPLSRVVGRRRRRGHRCAGGVRRDSDPWWMVMWRAAARCGKWAQHFSNAFCCNCIVKNKPSLSFSLSLTKLFWYYMLR